MTIPQMPRGQRPPNGGQPPQGAPPQGAPPNGAAPPDGAQRRRFRGQNSAQFQKMRKALAACGVDLPSRPPGGGPMTTTTPANPS